MTLARVWGAVIGALCIVALPAESIVTGGGSSGSRTVVVQGKDEYALTILGAREPVVQRWVEPTRFIVQFRAAPRVLAARQHADPLAARMESDLFSIDFTRLAARARGGASPAIRRRFETCFSGAAITSGREVIAAIRELPYVVGVFPDDSVHALLDVSVPHIGAPEVWARYGATGQGIIVAILDTGIDYDHPALGGGFGPAFRVVAGYDFVNDDGDPRDDVGHGTHVAGIVGANGGTLRGVAPDVHFHAYKVLGPGGGLQSDVIAGVERAVDPDQNPLTHDAVDVINLSLGGPGDADDPLSQAVDAATQAGVVVAVAAGNEGDWYSILSPAAARQAITVGAVDDFDGLAYFSSKGPALGSFALKPDVVAPGVEITSTAPGGGIATYQGTSMAAPHVAGAAALIRQIHPEWTPARVKASLMNTALDLGLPAIEQGTGRISVPAAVDAPFAVVPPSLSLGRLAQLTGVTVFRETLQVISARMVPQQIQLSLRNSPPGCVVTTPPAVTLPPMGTVRVPVEFTVDGALLPVRDRPWAIDGAFLASAGGTTCAIPYGLAAVDRVTFDVPDGEQASIMLHDRVRSGALARAGAAGLEAYVGPGDYDMIALIFGPTLAGDPLALVVRDVQVLRDTIVALARSDAPYELTWAAVEHDGKPLAPDLGLMLFHHETNFGYGVLGRVDRIAISAAGPEYRLDWGVHSYDPGRSIHLVSATRRGPFAAEVLSNRPEDYQRMRLKLEVPPGANATIHWLVGNTGWHRFWFGTGRAVPTAPGRLTEDFYMTPWARPEPPILGISTDIRAVRDAYYEELVGVIPALAATEPGEFRAYYLWNEVMRFRTNEPEYRSGMAPLIVEGALSSTPDSVFLLPSQRVTGFGPRLLLNRLGDFYRYPDATWRLFRNGVLAEEDTLRGSGLRPAPSYSFYTPPGHYVLEVSTPEYEIGGVRGHAVAAYAFAVPSSFDLSPPSITGLQFLSGDAPTDSLAFTAAASALRVDLSGPMVDSVRVEIAPHPDGTWMPIAAALEHEPNSSIWVATTPIPGTLHGLYSVRIRASSRFGDLTYTMTPAFVAGGTAAAVVEALEPDVSTERVVVQWKVLSASVTTLPVYRREPGMDWQMVGHATIGTDRATFEDSGVRPGRRYDYALQLSHPGGFFEFVGALSVTIPVTPFALHGARPMPASRDLLVEFSLPSYERAQLELFDVAGRLRRRLEVGDMGPGVHMVPLGRSLALRSGVYWIRLRQSGRVLSAKTAVL